MSNTEKLTAFATAVGVDIKDLQANKADKTALEALRQELQSAGTGSAGDTVGEAVQQAIDAAKAAVKSEILGGEADDTLDTIKEIADKLKELQNDESISGAITAKLQELKSQIDALAGADLVAAYTTAKA